MSGVPAGWLAPVSCLLVALVACGSPPTVSRPPPADVDVTVGVPYGAGQLDVLRLSNAARAPVAVLLHGCCGGKEDLFQLGYALAERGIVVFNAGWTAMPDGGTYAEAVRQASCAVGFARKRAGEFGGDPARVAVLGWSDGALVAAGAAYGVPPTGVACDAAVPDAFIGVSGFYGWHPDDDPYELGLVDEKSVAFFGGAPGADAPSWAIANPYARLGAGPAGGALLLVGDEDPLLPGTRCFTEALHGAGHEARLVVIFGANHGELILPRTRQGRFVVDETDAFLTGDGPTVPEVAPPGCKREVS